MTDDLRLSVEEVEILKRIGSQLKIAAYFEPSSVKSHTLHRWSDEIAQIVLPDIAESKPTG